MVEQKISRFISKYAPNFYFLRQVNIIKVIYHINYECSSIEAQNINLEVIFNYIHEIDTYKISMTFIKAKEIEIPKGYVQFGEMFIDDIKDRQMEELYYEIYNECDGISLYCKGIRINWIKKNNILVYNRKK